MAALYSERNDEMPDVKTISAGEFPGMRAAKGAPADGKGDEEEEDDGDERAKAL